MDEDRAGGGREAGGGGREGLDGDRVIMLSAVRRSALVRFL